MPRRDDVPQTVGDPKAIPEELMEMLTPADDDLLDAFQVSRDLLRAKQPTLKILNPLAVG